MEPDQEKDPDADETVERLLKLSGRRRQLPEHMKQQWEDSFQSGLEAGRRQAQKRKNSLLAISAAALIILGVAIPSWLFGPANAIPVRVKAVQGQVIAEHIENGRTTLASGAELAQGTELSLGEDSLLALDYDGYELRLNKNSRVSLDGRRIALLSGEIYFNGKLLRGPEETDADLKARSLTIDAGSARIRHVGTQFTVQRSGERVLSSVRHGSILIDTDRTEMLVEATDKYGQQVELLDGETVKWNTIDNHGPHWEWIYPLGRDFDIEGNTLHEFLSWSVRESGLTLEFSSGTAERYAHSTILHGSIARLDPNAAVETVLATTHLRARRGDKGLLRVVMIDR